jgi:hypothetical protein
VHAWHVRRQTELPVAGRSLVIDLRVRRPVCKTTACPQRTFRIPDECPIAAATYEVDGRAMSWLRSAGAYRDPQHGHTRSPSCADTTHARPDDPAALPHGRRRRCGGHGSSPRGRSSARASSTPRAVGFRRRFRPRGGRVRARTCVELGLLRRGRCPVAARTAALGCAARPGVRRTRLRHHGIHRSRLGTTDACVRGPIRRRRGAPRSGRGPAQAVPRVARAIRLGRRPHPTSRPGQHTHRLAAQPPGRRPSVSAKHWATPSP